MAAGLETTYSAIYPAWLSAQYIDANSDGKVQLEDTIKFALTDGTTMTVDTFIAGYVGTRYQDYVTSLMGCPIEDFIKRLNLLPSNTNGFPTSN